MRTRPLTAVMASAALQVTACATRDGAATPATGSVDTATSSAAQAARTGAFTTAASAPSLPQAAADAAGGDQTAVVGTVVRFSARGTQVDVTIDQDSPAARDFLSMLPLTLELTELSGREKIADLPRELDRQDTPGSDPEDGDLIYYVPWGNLGFYYNADGIGYSDATLHLGTYVATRDQLDQLQGAGVTVELVD